MIWNILLSSKATKECMYDYLVDCKNYGYCKWRIYDLKYYDDGKTAWHIVHQEKDLFAQNKNIPQMKNNQVDGCLHKSDNYLQDVTGTIQCVDVWLYLKLNP